LVEHHLSNCPARLQRLVLRAAPVGGDHHHTASGRSCLPARPRLGLVQSSARSPPKTPIIVGPRLGHQDHARHPRRLGHDGLGRQSAPQSRRGPSGGDWRCRSELAHRRLVRLAAGSDSVGRLLLPAARFRRHAAAGLLLGLAAADSAWVMLALVLLRYRGTPLLIALNQKWQGGLLQQRGLVLAIAFVLATVFMMADKARHQAIALGTVNPQDQLIQFLAQEITDDNKDFKAASQWPGRTMIAVRRAV